MEEKKQKWIIRKYLAGMPTKEIATHLQIPISTIYSILKHYKNFGKIIESKPQGRPKTGIKDNCKRKIKEYWDKFQCGSVKLHIIMSKEGYGVSQYKIQQVLDEYELTAPCPKRRGQRKYCSYRWPSCLDAWHTDWTHCPVTGKDLIAFIDDHSRFIVGYGIYDGATTENTLNCLYRILFEHTVPYAIITDRGSHFYANKIGKKKKGKCDFQKALEHLGIKHIVARAHHPQTNGKIERWFGTYKREFNGRFNNIEEYVRFYNYERPHQRLGYKTPAEIFETINCVLDFQIAPKHDDKKQE